MAEHPRYRVENGVHCVDVRVATLEQLFDNRDPAPFRERDLDPALVEYLFSAAEDLAAHGPFSVVVWSETEIDAGKVEQAYRAHVTYELARLDRMRLRLRRTGQVSLAIAGTLLLVLVSLSPLAEGIPVVGRTLREGLTIAGWVVMWRPVQQLVYDLLPLRRDRKLMQRLREAPFDIRRGAPPVKA